jgi:hypothetical protein
MNRAAQGAIMIVAVALGACDKRNAKAVADSTAAAAAAAAAAATAAATPAGGLASSRTFNSMLANYEFFVPDIWEKRYTATERSRPAEYPKAKTVTEFLFLPLADGNTPPAILTIVQYSDADWKAVSATAGADVGSVVAEGEGRVLVAKPLTKVPYAAGTEDGTALQGMLVTVEQVKQAVKLH